MNSRMIFMVFSLTALARIGVWLMLVWVFTFNSNDTCSITINYEKNQQITETGTAYNKSEWHDEVVFLRNKRE